MAVKEIKNQKSKIKTTVKKTTVVKKEVVVKKTVAVKKTVSKPIIKATKTHIMNSLLSKMILKA